MHAVSAFCLTCALQSLASTYHELLVYGDCSLFYSTCQQLLINVLSLYIFQSLPSSQMHLATGMYFFVPSVCFFTFEDLLFLMTY